MATKNPFFFRELPLDSPFCNREKELSDLTSYAKGKANVVLFSPRRYGKTSLIKRVQEKLSAQGFFTIYIDLFGVLSVEDASLRIAREIFKVTHPYQNTFQKIIRFFKSIRPVLKPDESGSFSLGVEVVGTQKTGLEMLEEAMQSLGQLSKGSKPLHVVFDEFQEIVTLRESLSMEALMRKQIQTHLSSYFFVGSRRRLLLEMFNERKRPFFQSAINYELKKLPHEELTEFLIQQFSKSEKHLSSERAQNISAMVGQHPYYTQKLAFFIYEAVSFEVEEKALKEGFRVLLESEKPVFESTLQGLALQQIVLLRALALEPTKSLFSIDYMKRHSLRSTGGMQGALKKLLLLDLIEKDDEGSWGIVDPVFKKWLCEAKT